MNFQAPAHLELVALQNIKLHEGVKELSISLRINL